MLAIRLQRTGRKGHAMYRMIVQDSSRTPTSGRLVAQIGHYDPHSKVVEIKKDKAEFYLSNGAQPSDRVAGLLKQQGVKLPKWVIVSDPQKRTTKHPQKLRKNQPKEEAKPEAKEEPKAEEAAEAPAAEPAEATTEQADKPAEKPAEAESKESPKAKEEPAEPAKE